MTTRGKVRIICIIFAMLLAGGGLLYYLMSKVTVVEIPTDGQGRLDRLRAIPYLNFTESVNDTAKTGVVYHDRERAWQGYNLYCSRSSPEAFLIDMDGEVVHKWTYTEVRTGLWDYTVMLDRGELLIANTSKLLIKLGRYSNLLWARGGMSVHHDIAIDDDGTLFVIGKEVHEHRGLNVIFSKFYHLTSEGKILDSFSTHEQLDKIKQAFDPKSFLDRKLDEAGHGSILRKLSNKLQSLGGKDKNEQEDKDVYEYFHANTITLLQDTELGRRDPRFKKGNLLICLRNINQIAVLEKDSWDILWVWGEDILEEPHHPTLTEDGTILIFDNGVFRQYSKVIEIDPITLDTVWEYVADPPEDFFSPTKGSAQRLPNGNTLVCDADNGRTFEVTREGEIVWEWFNPKFEEDRREMVYRMMRLAPERVASALDRPELAMQ
jgi:hypothetical protein